MTYNGRRGPNVSEYIANLNAIPADQDLPVQDNLNFEDDLALFTNTNFFDWDLGQNADLQPTLDSAAALDMKALEFPQGDFTFPEFDFTAAPPASYEPPHQLAAEVPAPQPSYASPSTAGTPTTLSTLTPTGSAKRKAPEPGSAESLEDSSRAAAEEDKRRRNTAASARFRVKKKQREQALEKSAKEMSDKVAALEGRINQLETENKWLKNLVTEKTESKEDIAALWKKYSAENERKGSERKDGVGTKA